MEILLAAILCNVHVSISVTKNLPECPIQVYSTVAHRCHGNNKCSRQNTINYYRGRDSTLESRGPMKDWLCQLCQFITPVSLINYGLIHSPSNKVDDFKTVGCILKRL